MQSYIALLDQVDHRSVFSLRQRLEVLEESVHNLSFVLCMQELCHLGIDFAKQLMAQLRWEYIFNSLLVVNRDVNFERVH